MLVREGDSEAHSKGLCELPDSAYASGLALASGSYGFLSDRLWGLEHSVQKRWGDLAWEPLGWGLKPVGGKWETPHHRWLQTCSSRCWESITSGDMCFCPGGRISRWKTTTNPTQTTNWEAETSFISPFTGSVRQS